MENFTERMGDLIDLAMKRVEKKSSEAPDPEVGLAIGYAFVCWSKLMQAVTEAVMAGLNNNEGKKPDGDQPKQPS